MARIVAQERARARVTATGDSFRRRVAASIMTTLTGSLFAPQHPYVHAPLHVRLAISPQ
jgi:hypothetical protein